LTLTRLGESHQHYRKTYCSGRKAFAAQQLYIDKYTAKNSYHRKGYADTQAEGTILSSSDSLDDTVAAV
jgi:outer membrane protein assembly factor BamA